MSKANKGKKKSRSARQTRTRVEKMLESLDAYRVKAHLTKRERSTKR